MQFDRSRQASVFARGKASARRFRGNLIHTCPLATTSIQRCFIPGPKGCASSCSACCVFVASSGGISSRFGHIRMCHFFLSSRAAHLHKHTPTQALILDQTTHRGTPNARKLVRTEPDAAHTHTEHRPVANHMVIFETFLPFFFFFLLTTEGRLRFGGILT